MKTKIRHQGQVVGSHERAATPVKGQMLNFHLRVKVDVIEVEQGEKSRIGTRAAKVHPDVQTLQFTGEQSRGETVTPLVEVSKHNPDTGEFPVIQDLWTEEFSCLMSALEKTGAEMDVEEVKYGFAQINVGAQASAPFASRYGEIVVLNGIQRKTTEQQVPVGTALQAAIFSEARVKAQFVGDKASLVAGAMPGYTQNLLQADDIGLDFAKHLDDALWADAPVEPTALVDVVSDDADGVCHLECSYRISMVPGAAKIQVRDRGRSDRVAYTSATMGTSPNLEYAERQTLPGLRSFADRAFSRAAGADLTSGNLVRLLKNAEQNYPAWLDAIASAKHHIHFESYIIHEDESGTQFADALLTTAQKGVRVRLIYDWLGGLGKTSRHFWNQLRAGGVEVRCYNPPSFYSPFGWLSRDHRKMLAVDGEIGFVTGLCIGRMWKGDPSKGIQPWRDTGVELRGPAVSQIEQAFAQVWAMTGGSLPEDEIVKEGSLTPVGNSNVRIVATIPATAGMFRLDQLVAALARERIWLTDAYYAGTTPYVQALRAAAQDGVDVRLLVPNATDVPLIRLLSRTGYRPLLEAGVRVFEWNGTMLHAKTALADSRWARVGSTNLNLASWLGNCELDAVFEDEDFARQMEAMYLEDLGNATEIVLDEKRKLRAPGEPRHPVPVTTSGGGSLGRAAAGAIRIGNAVGAAFTSRRVFESVEGRVIATAGAVLMGLSVLFAIFPRWPAYILALLLAWIGFTLLCRGYRLHRNRKASR